MSEPDYTLGLWGEFKKSASYTSRLFRPLLKVCFVLGMVLFLFLAALGPVNRQHLTWTSAGMQQAHAIGFAMTQYAENHDGKYPQGQSSTEVFQKLLEEPYSGCDPKIFYVPGPGKTEPVRGQKLKPENVCWDVTAGADATSPDWLPLVFLTGFKVTYSPGGSAVPIKPYSPLIRFWLKWSPERPVQSSGTGIAVFYKGNYALFLHAGTEAHKGTDSIIVSFNTPARTDGSLANFVPTDFKPDGKTYRQLTPKGILP